MLGVLSEAAIHTVLAREEGLCPNLKNIMKSTRAHSLGRGICASFHVYFERLTAMTQAAAVPCR